MKKKILLFVLAVMMALVVCAQFVSAEEAACTEGSHNIASAATITTDRNSWICDVNALVDGNKLTAGGSDHGLRDTTRTFVWSHPQVLSKLVFVTGMEAGNSGYIAGTSGILVDATAGAQTQNFSFDVKLYDAENNEIFSKTYAIENQMEIVVDLAAENVTASVAKMTVHNQNNWNNGQCFWEIETWTTGHGYKFVSDSATCIEDGVKTYKCVVCEGETTEVSKATGSHTYEEYTLTEEGDKHYQICKIEGCGATTEQAEHTYTADCDMLCDVCGYATRTSEVEHIYDHSCDKDCNTCKTVRPEAELVHTYGDEETGLNPACDDTCNVCGDKRTPPHVYEWVCDATCGACNYVREVNHTFDNECDTQCNICTYTREFQGHKYDSFIDGECNYCGFKRDVITTGNLTSDAAESAISYYATKYEQAVDEEGNLVVDEEGKPVYDLTKPLPAEVAPGVAAENAAAGKLMDGDISTSGIWSPGNDWYAIETNGYVLITLKEATDVLSIKIYVAGNWTGYRVEAFDAEGNAVIDPYSNYANDSPNGGTAGGYMVWAANSLEEAKEVKTVKITSTGYKWGDSKTMKVSEIELKVHVHAYEDICLSEACKDCGETREVPGHIFGAENACDVICNTCGQTIGETDIAHVYDGDTVDEEGNLVIGCDRFCNVCGDERKGTASHSYDQTKNGINICSDLDCNICGEARESEHEYDNDCDAMCNKCETIREVVHTYKFSCATECMVCGTPRTGEIHQWAYTCDEGRMCEACGATVENNKCIYDNACDTTCDVCGNTRTIEATAHVYDNACDTTCNVCATTRTITHTYANACDAACDVCGAAREVPAHVYDNVCDADCNVCTATRTVAPHAYDNACDADCNNCGATREVAAHVYDNACDAACNVCSATRAAAAHVYDNACDSTCNVCSAARDVNHTYGDWTVTTAATKDAKGSENRTCSVCNNVETKEIPQLDSKVSGATVAAIVIGCVAIVAVVGAAAYYFFVIKKKSV